MLRDDAATVALLAWLEAGARRGAGRMLWRGAGSQVPEIEDVEAVSARVWGDWRGTLGVMVLEPDRVTQRVGARRRYVARTVARKVAK